MFQDKDLYQSDKRSMVPVNVYIVCLNHCDLRASEEFSPMQFSLLGCRLSVSSRYEITHTCKQLVVSKKESNNGIL